ncbi:hypothetical protein [Simplicispira suum]|uniref:hypothetical protein n=1 Tax=Simplicispira suum TaxID=2109915 RepID=UPI002356654C|nr:hypothetical protein [Simplicispira suum]
MDVLWVCLVAMDAGGVAVFISLSPGQRVAICRQGHLEGIVVCRENAEWLDSWEKLVRADFTQTMDAHWRSRALAWNRVV